MILYHFMKALLDPVVFVLVILAIGFLISRKGSHKKCTVTIIFAFFILYMTSISPISNGLCYLLEKNYYSTIVNDEEKLDIVVVLAGGVISNNFLKEDVLSRQTASRLLHAVQVFKKSHADYLVCSGATDSFNEAEIMGIAAQRLGVPVSRIRLDTKSGNTRQHAIELDRMFADKNIKIGLVTSAYHMKRSENEFRKYFNNIIFFPTDYLYSYKSLSIFTFLPHSSNLYNFSTAALEIIGISWYKIKG